MDSYRRNQDYKRLIYLDSMSRADIFVSTTGEQLFKKLENTAVLLLSGYYTLKGGPSLNVWFFDTYVPIKKWSIMTLDSNVA